MSDDDYYVEADPFDMEEAIKSREERMALRAKKGVMMFLDEIKKIIEEAIAPYKQRVEELEEGRETWKVLANGRGEKIKELESQLAKKNKALEPFDKSYNWYVKGRKKWNMPIETEDRIAFDDPNYPLYLSHFRQASEAYDG